MQVVIFCEFQLHIRRVDNTRTVLWQSLVKQRGKASGEGCVGGTPILQVNRDELHIERRGWAQHENEAMPILIEAIGCVIKGEILLYGHINRSIGKGCFVSYHDRASLSFRAFPPVYHKVHRRVSLSASNIPVFEHFLAGPSGALLTPLMSLKNPRPHLASRTILECRSSDRSSGHRL